MKPRRMILGARVSEAKTEAANELRKRMTLSERCLWQRLRAGRIDGYHFRRQQVISGVIVDFYCHAAALAVEIDGPIHKRQRDYDRERDTLLEAMGVQVLRFRDEACLRRPDLVTAAIRRACGKRAAMLSREEGAERESSGEAE